MTSQDDLALLKQMYQRGEISDEQYDVLRRHVLWGTPLPQLMDDVPSPRREDPPAAVTPPAPRPATEVPTYAAPQPPRYTPAAPDQPPTSRYRSTPLPAPTDSSRRPAPGSPADGSWGGGAASPRSPIESSRRTAPGSPGAPTEGSRRAGPGSPGAPAEGSRRARREAAEAAGSSGYSPSTYLPPAGGPPGSPLPPPARSTNYGPPPGDPRSRQARREAEERESAQPAAYSPRTSPPPTRANGYLPPAPVDGYLPPASVDGAPPAAPTDGAPPSWREGHRAAERSGPPVLPAEDQRRDDRFGQSSAYFPPAGRPWTEAGPADLPMHPPDELQSRRARREAEPRPPSDDEPRRRHRQHADDPPASTRRRHGEEPLAGRARRADPPSTERAWPGEREWQGEPEWPDERNWTGEGPPTERDLRAGSARRDLADRRDRDLVDGRDREPPDGRDQDPPDGRDRKSAGRDRKSAGRRDRKSDGERDRESPGRRGQSAGDPRRAHGATRADGPVVRARRRRSLVAVLTSVVLALALAAGGVWWFTLRQVGVLPADYAKSICGSVRDWQQSVDSSNSTLVKSISREQDKTVVRSAVTTYYTTIAGRTDQLRTSIVDAGIADAPGGQAYSDTLATAVGAEATTLRGLSTRAAALDPAAAATFQIQLQSLLTGSETAVGNVSSALARPAAGTPAVLRAALSAEPACAPYVG